MAGDFIVEILVWLRIFSFAKGLFIYQNKCYMYYRIHYIIHTMSP